MTPRFTFAPAVRKRVKLKALAMGPSGSGKTMGALTLATRMFPGKVALLDSEHDRSEYYADRFQFDKLTLPNHHVDTYVAALAAAVEAGYEVVVIDSLTHGWEDVLKRKESEERANPRANSYTLWQKYGKEWDRLVRAILEVPVHVIATARSKQAYEQTERNGKKVVDKLGMAPILRDGTEYEFALVFDIQPSHMARPTKDNTNLFKTDEFYDLADPDVATAIRGWLDAGQVVQERIVTPEPPRWDAFMKPSSAAKLRDVLTSAIFTAEESDDWFDALTQAAQDGRDAVMATATKILELKASRIAARVTVPAEESEEERVARILKDDEDAA